MRRLIAFLVLALAACGGGDDGRVEVRVQTARGLVEIRAEVADSVAEQVRGLRGRESLGAREGMLFLFDGVEVRRFVMEDTLIPLDLVAIRGGRVVGIARMTPCEADPCPATETPPADAALEIPAGAAERLGIEVGDIVDAPGLL